MTLRRDYSVTLLYENGEVVSKRKILKRGMKINYSSGNSMSNLMTAKRRAEVIAGLLELNPKVSIAETTIDTGIHGAGIAHGIIAWI